MSVINDSRGPKQVPNTTEYLPKQARPAIDVKAMNTLIYNLGVKCRVYKTVPCPNVKSIDGAEHQINCPLCNGKGLYDSDEYIESTVGFLSQDRSKEFNKEQLGATWEEGTAHATFIAGVNLIYYTKVELPDFAKPFYQLVQRQEGSIDRLRYRAHKINYIVDKNGVNYIIDTDYEVEDGWVKWIGNKPAKGVIYSIHYDAIVTLRAMRAMHAGRWSNDSVKKDYSQNVEYPEQWLLKLDYLVIHEDDTGKKLDPNTIFKPGE